MANHAFIHLKKKPTAEQIKDNFDFINQNRFQGLLEVEYHDDYISIKPEKYLSSIEEHGFDFGLILNKNNPYLELRHVSGGVMSPFSFCIFSALGALLNSKYATDEGIDEDFANNSHLAHPMFREDFASFLGFELFKNKIKAYKEVDSFYEEFKKAMSFTTKPTRPNYPKIKQKMSFVNETDPYYINPFYLALTNHIDEYSLEALKKLKENNLNIHDYDKSNLKPIRKNMENITQNWIDKITEPLLFHALKNGSGIETLKYLTNELDINVKSNFNEKFLETFLSLPYYKKEEKIDLINHCLSKNYDFNSLVAKLSGKKSNEKFVEMLVPHIEKTLLDKNVLEKDTVNKKVKI